MQRFGSAKKKKKKRCCEAVREVNIIRVLIGPAVVCLKGYCVPRAFNLVLKPKYQGPSLNFDAREDI